MAWTDDQSWREPGETGFGAGRMLYWLATIIAVIIAVFAVADFFTSWAQGAPIVRIVAFAVAAAVWLIGRVCRAVLP